MMNVSGSTGNEGTKLPAEMSTSVDDEDDFGEQEHLEVKHPTNGALKGNYIL